MKKKMRNVLVTASIMAAFGATSAFAGTMSTTTAGGTLFASENFGATATAATEISPTAMTYTVSTTNGIVINPGGTIYVTARLTNGKFKAAPAALTGSALAVGGAGNGVVGAAVLSTDKTTATWPITYTTAATLGVGSTFVYTPPAVGDGSAINSVNTALATAGGTVSATMSMSAITPTATPNTGTAQAEDIDGPAATATIAKSAQAISVAISALPTYTGKIDLTAIPIKSNYILNSGVVPAAAKLGSVTFTDTTAVENQLDGSTAFDIAAAKTGTSTTIKVTPGTGQSFPVGAVLSVSSAADECVTTVGALSAFTTTTSTQAATLTVPAANTLSGTAIEICMTKPSTGNIATPITPSIEATINPVVIAATTKSDTATGTGYALEYNGSQVDVRNYIPAVAGAGFTQIIRVINTGSVSAAVSVAKVSEATGAVGASGVVATLPAGATKRLTQSEIEAVIGEVSGTERPRLRFSAPTNSMQIQSLMYSNGVYTDITGAQ